MRWPEGGHFLPPVAIGSVVSGKLRFPLPIRNLGDREGDLVGATEFAIR